METQQDRKSYVNNLGITEKCNFTEQMNRRFPFLLGLTTLILGCNFLKPSLRFEGDIVVMDSTQGDLIVRAKGGQPLLGKTIRTEDQIHFVPKLPFMAGHTYEASFADSSGRRVTTSHTFKVKSANPSLTSLFPSGDTVPANHLKFYLQFSERMQKGNIFRHFKLIDLTSGKAIEEPFRETELWSADGKQLTLWLHPGRQKTGVNLNIDLGPVLEPNRHYALEISSAWKSESGVPLKKANPKIFKTTTADRSQPDLSHWRLIPPVHQSKRPLIVKFKNPLDWALLHTMLSVLDEHDNEVAGEIKVEKQETQWNFIPLKPWLCGKYRLKIHWELEDLAGNNLERLFEVNLETDPSPTFTGPQYIKFEIR